MVEFPLKSFKGNPKGVFPGLLIYGSPGTGKTASTKATMTELKGSGVKYFYLSCKDIVSPWMGEAEIYLKDFFKEVEESFPAFIIMGKNSLSTRYLKITEKVSFNIASEASYVYFLSGQKLIKNAKNCSFWRVFEKLKLAVKQCYQTGQL